MAITSVGPALDPFTPTQGPAPDDAPNSAPDSAPHEAAPLPEGTGTVVDTSA